DEEMDARVLDRGVLEAQAAGTRLRLLHASSPDEAPAGQHAPAGGLRLARPAARTDAERRLEEAVRAALARAQSGDPVAFTVEVPYGSVTEVLAEASRSASLLVVGHSQHRDPVLGSTTDDLLHATHCPVMVVPGTSAPVRVFRRVVVGVDGSMPARAALLWAGAEARRWHRPLVPVHAWLDVSDRVLHDQERRTLELARLRDEVTAVLPDQRGLQVSPALASWPARSGLLHAAGPDDLLVVGTRGRRPVAAAMLGSVSAHCSRHAGGAVVVVPDDASRPDG
ncbi:MAG: universal stress protein, partial [Frankiales bacterium]|nr:universal stress protein [Frankiales bacterium]